MLACGEVNRGTYASHEVGAEIVVPRSCELYVYGYGYIGALYVLGSVPTGILLVKGYVLLTKVYRRYDAEREVLVEAHFPKHSDREPRVVRVYVGIPSLSRLWIHVAIVAQFQVLSMETEEETIMELRSRGWSSLRIRIRINGGRKIYYGIY